jgi:hypothetical protein
VTRLNAISPPSAVFDLVHVDGAQSYNYVANDSYAAFDLVADGGAIVLHD